MPNQVYLFKVIALCLPNLACYWALEIASSLWHISMLYAPPTISLKKHLISIFVPLPNE